MTISFLARSEKDKKEISQAQYCTTYCSITGNYIDCEIFKIILTSKLLAYI